MSQQLVDVYKRLPIVQDVVDGGQSILLFLGKGFQGRNGGDGGVLVSDGHGDHALVLASLGGDGGPVSSQPYEDDPGA
jgi:hypothetical protein